MKLSRLFYREAPYEDLPAETLQRLRTALRALVDAHPGAFYWIHRIDERRMLVADFFHASMLRYRGLEMVLFEDDTISYFRLPGATTGGRGHVARGEYRVLIESPAGQAYRVDVRKNAMDRFEISSCRPQPSADGDGDCVALPRHRLEPSKFADEMKQAIAGGVEWLYRSRRDAEPARRQAIDAALRDATWPAVVEGVCRDADVYLWMLKNGSE